VKIGLPVGSIETEDIRGGTPMDPRGNGTEALEARLAFIGELERLKTVERRNIVHDRSRQENSAEHSWQLAVMAIVLADHAAAGIDVGRAVRMALVHDIVEIDAGDTFCYDRAGHADKEEREERAADRLFGILPDEPGRDFRALWDEFEAGVSPEARFVRALDRLQPLFLHDRTGGVVFKEHGITRTQIYERIGEIESATPDLWPGVVALVERAVREGKVVDR
jgi:putative hydrolase of HD superfamily